MHYQFNHSLVGGTFDRFHIGHKKLLTKAFESSKYVVIGIATDELFKEKRFSYLIEDYVTREETVVNFLAQKGYTGRFTIVPIHDFYGTSLTDSNLDAIFITESNTQNVSKINEERKKRSFKSLEIVIVPYVLDSESEIISSERIRNGEIDREGNRYTKIFMSKKLFSLPESERNEMRQPIGTISKDMHDVISRLKDGIILIGVGDIVVTTAAKLGRQPDISIYDGRTRRHKLTSDEDVSLFHLEGIKSTVENPAGSITQKGALIVEKVLTNFRSTNIKQQLNVLGEEDLLAIPAILFSPLQSVVLYGQFDKGIVVVEVSEQNKKRVYDLFRKFQ